MPIVTMPDGTHVQFPDDMPRAQIQSMIARKFPEEIGALQDAAAKQAEPSWSASVLPISKDQAGNAQFDSNAGLLGVVKRSFMLPGDVMAGKVDPTSQEGINRAAEFAGTFMPTTPGMRAGEGMLAAPAMKKARVSPPSFDALKAAGDKGYETARGMGVDYSSQSVAKMAQDLQANLESRGIIPEVAPKTFAILEKLKKPPEGSVANISGIDAARRAFGKVGQDFSNPTDRGAGKAARGAVDQFLMDPPEGSVVSGPASEAARAISDARGNIAASKRSSALSGIGYAADLSASAANSGANLGNAVRQRVKSLLLDPKKLSGFTDAERRQLEQIVKGTIPQNLTRNVGNFLGGGGGLGAAVSSTAAGAGSAVATGNPYMAAAGIAAPLIGAASKGASNLMTKRALNVADEAVRMRSPLYRQMVADAPMVPVAPTRDAANLRLLLLSQAAEEQRAADRALKNEKLRKGNRSK